MLLPGLYENFCPDSVSFWLACQTNVANIAILKYAQAQKIHQLQKPKYFSESRGNSKQISNTSRTFEWAFLLKFIENFGISVLKDPCLAAEPLNIATN